MSNGTQSPTQSALFRAADLLSRVELMLGKMFGLVFMNRFFNAVTEFLFVLLEPVRLNAFIEIWLSYVHIPFFVLLVFQKPFQWK